MILLQFKRTKDTLENYYNDMTKIEEIQHTPILTGLNPLANLSERPRIEVTVLSLVAGRRSVKEVELPESLEGFRKARKTAKKSLCSCLQTALGDDTLTEAKQ